jgi:hypothetical protein
LIFAPKEMGAEVEKAVREFPTPVAPISLERVTAVELVNVRG